MICSWGQLVAKVTPRVDPGPTHTPGHQPQCQESYSRPPVRDKRTAGTATDTYSLGIKPRDEDKLTDRCLTPVARVNNQTAAYAQSHGRGELSSLWRKGMKFLSSPAGRSTRQQETQETHCLACREGRKLRLSREGVHTSVPSPARVKKSTDLPTRAWDHTPQGM